MKKTYSFKNKVSNILFLVFAILIAPFLLVVFLYGPIMVDRTALTSYGYWFTLVIMLGSLLHMLSMSTHNVILDSENKTITLFYLFNSKIIPTRRIEKIVLRCFDGSGPSHPFYQHYIEIYTQDEMIKYPIAMFMLTQNLNVYVEIIQSYAGITPKIGKMYRAGLFEWFRKKSYRNFWQILKGLIYS